jgi:hypothetical protein
MISHTFLESARMIRLLAGFRSESCPTRVQGVIQSARLTFKLIRRQRAAIFRQGHAPGQDALDRSQRCDPGRRLLRLLGLGLVRRRTSRRAGRIRKERAPIPVSVGRGSQHGSHPSSRSSLHRRRGESGWPHTRLISTRRGRPTTAWHVCVSGPRVLGGKLFVLLDRLTKRASDGLTFGRRGETGWSSSPETQAPARFKVASTSVQNVRRDFCSSTGSRLNCSGSRMPARSESAFHCWSFRFTVSFA